MSLLALGVQFYAAARIVEHIPAGAFYPKPKVDSAVVRLERRPEPIVSGVSAEAFFRAAREDSANPGSSYATRWRRAWRCRQLQPRCG